MASAADSAWITKRAMEFGFDLCGVVRAEVFPELAHFEEWLARGYAGEMSYLEDPRRRNLALIQENLRSAIVCALNYNTNLPYSVDAAAASNSEPRGWISRYAWGRDYHEVLWEKLNALAAFLGERFPEPFAARAYADTGPVAERVFAKHAGLGWLGKNTLLLNESLGSWFFLGVILTSLDLTPSLAPAEAPPADLCGNCRQCLDACPTGALVEPYVLDARRCISYLTIELRGNIPEEFREAMGRHVYGCDICQDVCPFNRKAPATALAEFQPRGGSVATSAHAPKGAEVAALVECERPGPPFAGESLSAPRLEWLAGMSAEEFREIFRGSAVKRTKWKGLVRNACIALGNAKFAPDAPERGRILALLHRLAGSGESAIAESARWALGRIQ
ncbi:MAG TPA: tRNA epoxyqueuosine(34) reductase QueG [Candidatus Acidoferrum sp.]|nr:tRNA epoxyqueuosine(34) reductase QueG [Candidatus Acidoferrum sp.]